MNKHIKIYGSLALAVLAGVVAGHYLDRRLMPETAAHAPGPVRVEAAMPSPGDTTGRPVASLLVVPPGGFDPDVVKTATLRPQTISVETPSPGKLAYDVQRAKLASARVAGRVERILVYEGALVHAGQPLAELYSPEYVAAENEFMLSLNAYKMLGASGMTDMVEDSRQTVQSAESKLRVLGASSLDIARIREHGTISDVLTIRAPITGTIVKRDMDQGSYLNVGDSLMSIIDTSVLWFTGNLYESDIRNVHVGQSIDIETPAYPGRRYAGRITFIAPNVDADTHTLQVRCDVPNPDHLLKPEMYATARIVTGNARALVVPQSAIVKVEDKTYLMTAPDAGHFSRLAVHGMARDDGTFAITTGVPLDAPVKVVVQGGMLLNEMLLKQES